MIAEGNNEKQTKPGDDQQVNSPGELAVTLKWDYNYFSVASDESFNDWRENLPMSIKEALYDDEQEKH
jgi:hypothetical protein